MRALASLAALLAMLGVAPSGSRAGGKPDLVPPPAWTDTIAVDTAARSPSRVDRGKESAIASGLARVAAPVRALIAPLIGGAVVSGEGEEER